MLKKELKGRYRIIESLGGGGFGKTYLAEDIHRPGSPQCVVKQLMPISKDAEFLQIARRLFKTEAETLENLGRHPQIPQLLAYFEEDEEFYLVEELVKGQCLADKLLIGKQLASSEVINLIKEVLEVLVFIHDQGVIHRDIKPGNIVRREQDNRLVLIDFGAVKHIQPQVLREQGNVTLTTLTIAIGTNHYAPLEQLAGQPKFNSDIYSLGVVGIQALTGTPPSQLKRDPHTGTVLWRHLAKAEENLARIIDKMTHCIFVERYQSAIKVLQDLEQLELSNSVTPPTIAPTVAATSLAKPASHALVLTSDQHAQLDEVLQDFVGAIGPLLLQQCLTEVSSTKELGENLSTHLPQRQRAKFLSMVMTILQKSPVPKESSIHHQLQEHTTFTLKTQVVDNSFISRCEQELTNFIGPISTFLVEKVLESHCHLSPEDIIESLASEIPDPQKAAEFRHRLLP